MKTWYKCDERKNKDKNERLSPIKLVLVSKFCKQWTIWLFLA